MNTTKQNKIKQSKAKQNKSKSKTKQNKQKLSFRLLLSLHIKIGNTTGDVKILCKEAEILFHRCVLDKFQPNIYYMKLNEINKQRH